MIPIDRELLLIEPAMIDVPPDRLRHVNAAQVAQIAQSMRDIGQITPITVSPASANGRRTLITGAHRLAALKEAGLLAQALEFDGNRDQQRLQEIDENLYRHELNALDEGIFLAERREIYERLHGKVKAGRSARRTTDNLSQLTFFDDVTGLFGLSRVTIERGLRRFHRIDPDVRYLLAGTRFAAIATELDAIGRLGPAEQKRVVKLLLQEAYPAKNVAAALKIVRGQLDALPDVDATQLRRLTEAWRKAGTRAKGMFLDFLIEKKEIGREQRIAAIKKIGDEA